MPYHHTSSRTHHGQTLSLRVNSLINAEGSADRPAGDTVETQFCGIRENEDWCYYFAFTVN